MILLVTAIEWDCADSDPVEDCDLPTAVLVINVPPNWHDHVVEDAIRTRIGDAYAFSYGNRQLRPLQPCEILTGRVGVVTFCPTPQQSRC